MPRRTTKKENKKIVSKKNITKKDVKKAPIKKSIKKLVVKKIKPSVKETPIKKEIYQEDIQEINYPKEKQIVNNYQQSNEQKDKTLLMWAGVTFFMVLIGFVWILNTKKVFRENSLNAPESNVNWSELGEGIGETWGTLKGELEEIKELNQASTTEEQIDDNLTSSSSSLSESMAGVQTNGDQLTKEEFEELKQRLKEIEAQLETSNSINE